MNRPLRVTTPSDDAVGGYAYSSVDYLGLTTETTNAAGQIERVQKNRQGQVIRRVNNANAPRGSVERGELTYRYDAYGNLLDTTALKDDGTAVTTSLEYDGFGRKRKTIDPDMGTWEYRYNGFGELVGQKDAKGQVTSMQYDPLGRLIRREERTSEGDTNPVVTAWRYDTADGSGIGKLHTVIVSGGGGNNSATNNEEYRYDALGRVISVVRDIAGQRFSSGQSYDAVSRPETSVYPRGFQVRNVYNHFGFLKEVCRADSGHDDLYWMADSYALDGRIDGEVLGNGILVDRVYSETTGRLRHAQAGVGPNVAVQNLSYTYDVLGNVRSRTDVPMNRSESFSYDGLNRLTGQRVETGASLTPQVNVAYDALGNITHKSDVGGYTYGGPRPHALTAAGGNSYDYDANGNMISGGGRSMLWTINNQALRIGSGDAWSFFGFDASGQRVVQQNDRGKTIFYVGGSYEEVRRTSGPTEYKHYIQTPSGRTAVRVERSDDTVETRWFHGDGLGSIGAITDETGAVVQRFAYDAWGKRLNPATGAGITSDTNGGFARGYTDHEQLDDLGLVHMNGRVFEPALGRFLAADPFVDDAGDSQALNRYSCWWPKAK